MELSFPYSVLRAIAMRRALLPQIAAESAAMHGPALIALGLAVLAAAMIWPAVPAVAAMALVALGATGVTVARFRTAAGMIATIILHSAVYTTLYALFVGAVLHRTVTQGNGRIGALDAIDLAISILPMVLTWWLVISAVQRSAGGEDAPAR